MAEHHVGRRQRAEVDRGSRPRRCGWRSARDPLPVDGRPPLPRRPEPVDQRSRGRCRSTTCGSRALGGPSSTAIRTPGPLTGDEARRRRAGRARVAELARLGWTAWSASVQLGLEVGAQVRGPRAGVGQVPAQLATCAMSASRGRSPRRLAAGGLLGGHALPGGRTPAARTAPDGARGCPPGAAHRVRPRRRRGLPLGRDDLVVLVERVGGDVVEQRHGHLRSGSGRPTGLAAITARRRAPPRGASPPGSAPARRRAVRPTSTSRCPRSRRPSRTPWPRRRTAPSPSPSSSSGKA